MDDNKLNVKEHIFFQTVWSEWHCRAFGGDGMCVFRPLKGKEPNWFWRKMQFLILGNVWVKDEVKLQQQKEQ